jgi:hypothetical protein
MSTAAPGISDDEARRRQAIVDELIAIGIEEGVFHVMARDGQLLALRCETPKCYCDEGRTYFPKPPIPDSDWDPTLDHYPILKSNGGHKEPWNVRLAHKTEELNRVGVLHPQGSGPWTAETVRSAFVSS